MLLDALFFIICALVLVAAVLVIRWFFMDMDEVFEGLNENRIRQDKTDIRLDKIEDILNIKKDDTTKND